MNCKIKVISPVHIGSGESYGSSEYLPVTMLNKNKEKVKTFKRIDVSNYYLNLDDDKKEEFINNLSNTDFRLMDFDKKIPNEYRKYLALDKTSSRPNANQEIEDELKLFNKAYIPGSSIKGAIKTAILYQLFDYDDIDTVMDFINKKGRDFTRSYNNFMDDFFTSDIRRPSAQKDIMKFLQISDTDYAKQISIYDIYTVMAAEFNRRKTNVPYRFNKKSNEPTISYFETIDSGNTLEFTINNNYNSKVHRNLKLEDKINLIDINNIKKAIYEFSNDFIQNELEYSEEYGIDSLTKFYNNISKLNTIDAPLLKIGAGSGFNATTVAMKIKENPYAYDELIDKKKGYDYCFPKSRKITRIGGKPLGWVQLSFKEC